MENPTGKLSLEFKKKESGKTYLARQFFKLPLQIMSPHYQDDDGTAFLYMLNPSGGILQHDRLLTEIILLEDSKVLVTTPSSTKFYKMDDGYAKIVNNVTVKRGGVLEYLPEHNVPFALSETYQETTFNLHEDSILIALDMVTAGRVSRGEVFQYDTYSSKTKIYVDGKLQIYDNSIIRPKEIKVDKIGLLEGHESNGTIYVYAKGIKDTLVESLNEMQCDENIHFAAGKINENLLIVRFLGNNIIDLQKVILNTWGKVRENILNKKAVRIRKF